MAKENFKFNIIILPGSIQNWAFKISFLNWYFESYLISVALRVKWPLIDDSDAVIGCVCTGPTNKESRHRKQNQSCKASLAYDRESVICASSDQCYWLVNVLRTALVFLTS